MPGTYITTHETINITTLAGRYLDNCDVYSPVPVHYYEQLLEVLVNEAQVEFIERTFDGFRVYDVIPKHWLYRVMSIDRVI